MKHTPMAPLTTLTITSLGAKAGGELKVSKRFGKYFIWPSELSV